MGRRRRRGAQRLRRRAAGERRGLWLRRSPRMARPARYADGGPRRAARYGSHPRAFVWGPLEARMQHADCVILGGLVEGTWPPEAPADPWMSRPMRTKFGLPPAGAAHRPGGPRLRPGRRRRLGRAARSGASRRARPAFRHAGSCGWRPCSAAKELAHAPGRGSGPVARLAGPARPARERRARPCAASRAPGRGAARPPVGDRGRHLARATPMPSTPAACWSWSRSTRSTRTPAPPIRGSFVHKALETFVRTYPDDLPEDALDRLLAIGESGHERDRWTARRCAAIWWRRFERIAAWFVALERERRRGALPPSGRRRGAS